MTDLAVQRSCGCARTKSICFVGLVTGIVGCGLSAIGLNQCFDKMVSTLLAGVALRSPARIDKVVGVLPAISRRNFAESIRSFGSER